MKTPYAPDRLRSYWLAHKGLLIVMILSRFGCNMLNAAVVIEQGQMLDQLILTGPGMALLEAAGQFLLLVLVVQLLRAIKRWTTRRFASVTCAAMRSALLTAVLNGRIDTEAGDLLNRGMQDVELCTDGMRKLTTELFDTGVLLGVICSLIPPQLLRILVDQGLTRPDFPLVPFALVYLGVSLAGCGFTVIREGLLGVMG